jgi:hypothetical protein
MQNGADALVEWVSKAFRAYTCFRTLGWRMKVIET